MIIYIIGERILFDNNKINILKEYGQVIFAEKENYINEVINNNSKKIIIYDPDFGGWSFPQEIIEKTSNLKAIILGTTDKSYIDLKACNNRGIEVINIPKYAADSVAEYLVMYMFNCAKKIPLQIKNNNQQEFTPIYEQMQLKNKKVGIVGFGNIGSRIANMCSGIGMNVCYWDRNQKDCNYSFVSLEEIFSSCDVIYLCLAINPETKTIISDDLLDRMKSNCIFISCTGNKLFNFKLIEKKIEDGSLYGYALEEPNRSLDSYNGNVMVTSEYAWFTKEAGESRINLWFENIIEFFKK